MKLNFGHEVTIGLSAFIIYILFLVYKTTTVKSELESEDYYLQEVAYGERMEQERNFLRSGVKIKFEQEMAQFTLMFDGLASVDSMNGSVHFVRFSDAKLDRKYELQLDSRGQQVFEVKDFVNGNYEVQISWLQGGEEYYYETNVYL